MRFLRESSPLARFQLPRSLWLRWPRSEAGVSWLAPLVLTVPMVACGLLVPPFALDAGEAFRLLLLYGTLAAFLHLAARLAWRANAVLGCVAAAGVAAVPLAQVRLDAELLSSKLAFLVAWALVGGVYLVLLHATEPRASEKGTAVQTGDVLAPYGALALLFALSAWCHADPAMRSLLLRHQRLFGQPAYYLGERSITAERDRIWSRQTRLASAWENAERAVTTRPHPVVPAGGDGPASPHILFLLVDTLRADGLAAYGGDPDWMPRTNALADRSVVFRDVLANASWTRASCASIFTGLLPEEHGAARFHEMLSDQWTTMPELLKAAGYQTAAFVANWVQVGVSTGFAQGFDLFEELVSAEEVLASDHENVRDLYARAERVHDRAIAYLRSDERRAAAARGEPAFLYLHYLDPHAPYLAGVEPGTEHDPRERKRGFYRQELRYFDRELAKFLEQIETLLPGPKVIVLTSDHGEEFWEHGEWGHGHALYRELTAVPAFVHFTEARPGTSGVQLDAPLELRDLYDLVANLPDPHFDPVAWAEARARTTRYASQYLDRVEDARPDKKWTGLRLIERGGHELIWSAFGPSIELYDLEQDPLELKNRAADDPERVDTLWDVMRSHVRFWTRTTRVERSSEDLDFLRALGYMGG